MAQYYDYTRTNKIQDKRFGENDRTMDKDQKMLIRFTKQRQVKKEKQNN